EVRHPKPWERRTYLDPNRSETIRSEPKRWQLPTGKSLSSDLGGGPPRPNPRPGTPPSPVTAVSTFFQNTSEPPLQSDAIEPTDHETPIWDTPRHTHHAGL